MLCREFFSASFKIIINQTWILLVLLLKELQGHLLYNINWLVFAAYLNIRTCLLSCGTREQLPSPFQSPVLHDSTSRFHLSTSCAIKYLHTHVVHCLRRMCCWIGARHCFRSRGSRTLSYARTRQVVLRTTRAPSTVTAVIIQSPIVDIQPNAHWTRE